MRRTNRDGTRTLCPCLNSLARLPDFFCFWSPSPEKSAAARVPACAASHANGYPLSLQGEHARLSELSCRPCTNSRPQGPTVPFQPPCCPAACSGPHVRCPESITARHHKTSLKADSGTGSQDGACAASDKFPARGLCSGPDCLFGGERRRRITQRQQILQTVRLPDSWFDDQTPAVHAQAHHSPLFRLQLCQKAGRNGQQHGLSSLCQRARFQRGSQVVSFVCFLSRCSGLWPGPVRRRTGHGQTALLSLLPACAP